jgi:zinc protease
MNLNDADYPALFLGVQILSRQGLWQRVREREGLSYSVTSNLSAPVQGNGATIDISASFAPQNSARLRTAIREVLLEKREQGFSSFEVGFAKSAIVSRRANTVGEIANNLRFDRPLDFGARFDNAYRQLDAAAINAALKKHLNPDRLWEVVVGSFKD